MPVAVPQLRARAERRPVVRALVDGGNAVIFDDVLHDREMYDTRVQAFAGLDVFAVVIRCALDVLEGRERSRRDRVLGRARGLALVVHTFCSYDVVVHTSSSSSEECVAEILATLAARSSSGSLTRSG